VHNHPTELRKREVSTIAHIVVEDSENLEKAIKRFKRMVEKEGIIREWKKREYFEKPSTVKNRKNKALQRKLMKKTRGKGASRGPSSSRNA
jgi:small subunit ribosomal protein S21